MVNILIHSAYNYTLYSTNITIFAYYGAGANAINLMHYNPATLGLATLPQSRLAVTHSDAQILFITPMVRPVGMLTLILRLHQKG